MFRAHRSHHQERQIVSIQPLVAVILCWWPCRVQVVPTCTRHGHILGTTSHVPFPLFRSYQSISPGLRMCSYFGTRLVLRWGVVSTSPNPQAWGPPLVGWPRLLSQYIRNYSPFWRPFLRPQLEDAPCRGLRNLVLLIGQKKLPDSEITPLQNEKNKKFPCPRNKGV